MPQLGPRGRGGGRPLCRFAVLRTPLLFFTLKHLIELHHKRRQLVRVLFGTSLRREHAPITRLWGASRPIKEEGKLAV